MHLIAFAWMYVAVLMAAAEAIAPNGSVLGAMMTFVTYGVLPLAIVLYIAATPARRRAQRNAELRACEVAASVAQPDGGEHPPGDAVTPVGKEP